MNIINGYVDEEGTKRLTDRPAFEHVEWIPVRWGAVQAIRAYVYAQAQDGRRHEAAQDGKGCS